MFRLKSIIVVVLMLFIRCNYGKFCDGIGSPPSGATVRCSGGDGNNATIWVPNTKNQSQDQNWSNNVTWCRQLSVSSDSGDNWESEQGGWNLSCDLHQYPAIPSGTYCDCSFMN